LLIPGRGPPRVSPLVPPPRGPRGTPGGWGGPRGLPGGAPQGAASGTPSGHPRGDHRRRYGGLCGCLFFAGNLRGQIQDDLESTAFLYMALQTARKTDAHTDPYTNACGVPWGGGPQRPCAPYNSRSIARHPASFRVSRPIFRLSRPSSDKSPSSPRRSCGGALYNSVFPPFPTIFSPPKYPHKQMIDKGPSKSGGMVGNDAGRG
jgi:hypothetical protein